MELAAVDAGEFLVPDDDCLQLHGDELVLIGSQSCGSIEWDVVVGALSGLLGQVGDAISGRKVLAIFPGEGQLDGVKIFGAVGGLHGGQTVVSEFTLGDDEDVEGKRERHHGRGVVGFVSMSHCDFVDARQDRVCVDGFGVRGLWSEYSLWMCGLIWCVCGLESECLLWMFGLKCVCVESSQK